MEKLKAEILKINSEIQDVKSDICDLKKDIIVVRSSLEESIDYKLTDIINKIEQIQIYNESVVKANIKRVDYNQEKLSQNINSLQEGHEKILKAISPVFKAVDSKVLKIESDISIIVEALTRLISRD